MSVITVDPMPAPQPHRRSPDLSGLTPSERAELKAFIARLQRGGGFDPRSIRLTLSPEELARLKHLESLVRWAVPPAVRPAETSKEVAMPLSPQTVHKRRMDAVSDLEDAVCRLALALDEPTPTPINPRLDAAWEGALRLEQTAHYLARIAARFEQPALTTGA